MTRPDANYLRSLIGALVGDPQTPVSLRNECHRLMLAIDRNDFDLIRESVERIEGLARNEPMHGDLERVLQLLRRDSS